METSLHRLTLSGTARDMGRALGRWGREAVQGKLCRSALWRDVTDMRHKARVEAMAALTAARFPDIHAELQGMAEGLDLPFAEVMAWNCRGDLLASVPDGCTSLLYPGTAPKLAHNEDGLPLLRGHCGIVEAFPDGAAAFVAFCYPGSIPGHTFAATSAGVLQTVNNMRLTGVQNAGLPRMVLGRAVLSRASAMAAIDMLQAHPAAGGFHFALADMQGVHSVEFGAGMVSVRPVGAPAAHANHALHLDVPQRITTSSYDRQVRAEALLAERSALDILLDRDGPGLPIHRSEADDPDEENTLGTAVLSVAGGVVRWEVHDGADGPVHSGRIAIG